MWAVDRPPNATAVEVEPVLVSTAKQAAGDAWKAFKYIENPVPAVAPSVLLRLQTIPSVMSLVAGAAVRVSDGDGRADAAPTYPVIGVVVSTPVNSTIEIYESAGVAPVLIVTVPEPGDPVVIAHHTCMDDLAEAPGSATCIISHEPLIENVAVVSDASFDEVSEIDPVLDTTTSTRAFALGLIVDEVHGLVTVLTGVTSVLIAIAIIYRKTATPNTPIGVNDVAVCFRTYYG